MKKVLLIDDSLTVQKVVALTLDKQCYGLWCAKNRPEAISLLTDVSPDLVLLSDKVPEVSWNTFPKELEVFLRGKGVPPLVLLTSQEIQEARGFNAVLKKPFSPQGLKAVVSELVEVEELQEKRLVPSGSSEGEEQKQERQFHEAFRDEADLVRQTMRHLTDEKPAAKGLWAPVLNEQPTAEFLSSPTRMDSGSSVPKGGLSPNLDELVDQWLSKAVPPIVERMVQERLDKLLSEAENQPEIKP